MPVPPLFSHKQNTELVYPNRNFGLMRTESGCGSQTWPHGHQPEETGRSCVCSSISCFPKWVIACTYLS